MIALLLVVTLAFTAAPARANPFATIPPGHWAYDALEGLASLDVGRAYVRQRLSVGDPLTYFDLALWVGDALDAMRAAAVAARGGDWSQATLAEIVEAFNDAMGAPVIGRDRVELLRSLLELSSAHLEVLGYTLPSDLVPGGVRLASVDGLASLFEDFRLRGEGRIRYRGLSGAIPESAGGYGDHASTLEQTYSLRMTGSVSDVMRIGAHLSGEGRIWNGDGDPFALRGGAVEIGIAHSAIARLGEVTAEGLNPMVLGAGAKLSGFQAGVNVGQVGSRLLVASLGPGDDDDIDAEGFVTALDSSVQVSDRLLLGASLARVAREQVGDAGEHANTIVRIGGTYAVSPNLTLAGDLAQSLAGGAVRRVGAVLRPSPALTLGAFLYTAESGYRPLLSEDESEDGVSRLDLSAEVGRWILSFRRQNVIRTTEGGDQQDGNLTMLSLEYPFTENAVARATHEREERGKYSEGTKTAFDIEVRLENGKVSLGYVLESPGGGKAGADGPIRTTKATLEHAVGPVAKAQAGFLIVDQSEGSETSSNLGVQYTLGNTSVSLQYEIFTRAGDKTGKVTTAEVAIRF